VNSTRWHRARIARAPKLFALVIVFSSGLLAPSPAGAVSVVDNERISLDLGGDIKGRFFAMFPYEHLLMPEDPIGQASLLARAHLELSIADFIHISAHHQLAADILSGSLAISGAMLGDPSAQGAPEAIPMSWSAFDEESQFQLRGRMDRLSLRLRLAHMDLKVGRQPVSFGSTWFFTPLDLVAPFSPTVIDREYKPGIDAVRADFYIGTATQVTAVAAYAGSWQLDGMILAANGRINLGLWDLSILLGAIHEDFVAGIDATGSIGDFAVRAAATLTVPPQNDSGDESKNEDPFLRIVLGGDYRTPFGLSVMAEIYYQDIGEIDPAQYLRFAQSPRFVRGELWSMGRLYGAVSLAYELNPLISTNVALTVNILDGSALLSPGISWSIANNADLVFGAMFALGKPPADIELIDLIREDGSLVTAEDFDEIFKPRSEFGLMPHTAYLQINSYF